VLLDDELNRRVDCRHRVSVRAIMRAKPMHKLMIDHFEIKVSKFKECKEFYSSVLRPLNIDLKWSDESVAGFGFTEEGKTRFLIEEAMHVSLCHIAFSGIDRNSVNEFHAIGKANGYTSNGEPGLREEYAPDYYAAFLLDPDGNNWKAR